MAVTLSPEQQRALVETQNEIERDRQEALRATQREMNPDWDAGKTALAIGRGTGEGIASTADLPLQGGQWLYEVAKNAALEATGTPYERQAVSAPLTDFYNENMPAPPAGYENVNDIAAVLGPAVVETALSAGVGAPAAFARAGAKGVAKGLARKVATNVGSTGAGVIGSEFGGAIGEQLGGDVGQELGSFGGALLGGPALRSNARAGRRLVSQAIENPLAALGGLGGGGAGLHALSNYDLPGSPSLGALLAAAVPPTADAYRGVKNAVTNPAGLAQTVGGTLPGAAVRVGAGEIYEDNPYLWHANQGLPPVQQMKNAILGIR